MAFKWVGLAKNLVFISPSTRLSFAYANCPDEKVIILGITFFTLRKQKKKFQRKRETSLFTTQKPCFEFFFFLLTGENKSAWIFLARPSSCVSLGRRDKNLIFIHIDRMEKISV